MVIERMAVVGAGQMGAGVAQIAAQAGVEVVLLDATPELARKGVDRVAASLSKLVEKGKMTAGDKTALLSRIKAGEKLEDCARAQLFLECIVENAEVKKELLRKVDALLAPEAILATNTSSISITSLAAATRRPERFVGLHFFNPVPLMQLVEIIRGLQTSDTTYRTVMELTKRFGKSAVTCKDRAAFVVNRMLIQLLNEACCELEEGLASAEDIDAGAKMGLNHPMGPLALADFIGLDTCLAIAEVCHREFGDDKYRPSPILRQYVAAGWLGKKAGRGFYSYT